MTECSLGGSSRQTGCQSKRWRCRRVTHNTSSPKTSSSNLLLSTSITSCFRVTDCQRAGWPSSRQVSLVGWWPLLSISGGLVCLVCQLGWQPCPWQPAPVSGSQVSQHGQSSRSPALSGKHNRDSRPPPREETMSKRLEAGLVLKKKSWQIVELLAIMFFCEVRRVVLSCGESCFCGIGRACEGNLLSVNQSTFFSTLKRSQMRIDFFLVHI